MPTPFSPSTFAILSAILLASVAMLLWNVWRSIYRRRWIDLKDWARRNRMQVHTGTDAALPAALRNLLPETATAAMVIADGRRALVRSGDHDARWHVLVIQTESTWPTPAGLKPVLPHAGRLVTLLNLLEYPSLPGAERFLTHATALRPAKALADSHARALLPPDIGLVVKGNHLLLDFSTRPFDPLEFSRLLPLGEQLLAHLRAR